jgi:2-polyprenyl-6-methoxyphenol hydroxylase-like FAD-dependent oxidoreductase
MNTPSVESTLKTAVIGAGPAGLLFTLIGKIKMGDAWHVALYDKRESYARTHRLRMAPEPYRAIQNDLQDPRFDSLIDFLEEHHFSPEVNLLEAKLSALLSSLGVKKIVREFTSLEALSVDTIVGADSVHSTVRELVRGGLKPEVKTHERVARLRVTGSDLPARLGVLDQFRLSKVLGSVVDYRVNQNGFAEIDLFLTEEEHKSIMALGASPKEPIPIDSARLGKLKAPLMRAIVSQLEKEGRSIVVQSVFTLEHSVMPSVKFVDKGRPVFLVGDAAVSLPFFRGMACLASCAHALAQVHATRRFDEYDKEVRAIVARELGIVRARASAVKIVRELIRISSLLPFPLQSWWLSAAREPEPDRLSPGAGFNMALSSGVFVLVLLGLLSPWLALLSFPAQLLGGVAYRWALDLEPGPHRYLRRIWEVQIALVAILGVALFVTGLVIWFAVLFWWFLGLSFVLGIYVFEGFIARRLLSAKLDE